MKTPTLHQKSQKPEYGRNAGYPENKTQVRPLEKIIPIALVPAAITRSWFSLTPGEQKALLTVITILLIGMMVSAWHKKNTHTKNKVAETDRIQMVDE